MNQILKDYFPLAVFIVMAVVIALPLMIAPFIVAYKKPDPEKLSAYECGFNAFDDARMKFDNPRSRRIRSGRLESAC